MGRFFLRPGRRRLGAWFNATRQGGQRPEEGPWQRTPRQRGGPPASSSRGRRCRWPQRLPPPRGPSGAAGARGRRFASQTPLLSLIRLAGRGLARLLLERQANHQLGELRQGDYLADRPGCVADHPWPAAGRSLAGHGRGRSSGGRAPGRPSCKRRMSPRPGRPPPPNYDRPGRSSSWRPGQLWLVLAWLTLRGPHCASLA